MSDYSSIAVPRGSVIYLQPTFDLPGVTEGAAVLILPPGIASVDELLSGPPKLCAAVTHDRGMSWPDAVGCQLAQAAICDGGFVALQFTRTADAARCKRRLEKARAMGGRNA